jgi:type VI secretion system protein ImpK
MVATLHHPVSNQTTTDPHHEMATHTIGFVQSDKALVLAHRVLSHHPKAGLNPLADAAAYLFSTLGKLKYQRVALPALDTLQRELIQEVHLFQESLQHHGYATEYILICRYVICAFIDDTLISITQGHANRWQPYSLLANFNQDTEHQDKFFRILERLITEPARYIDLLEFMYLCLNLGYKGPYRTTAQCQYQLEQTTHRLYKHIRHFRGNFNTVLSPVPLKTMHRVPEKVAGTSPGHPSLLLLLLATSSVIMAIFVSLGYLTNLMTDEAYRHIAHLQHVIVEGAKLTLA